MIIRYINRIEIKQKIAKLEKEFGIDKNKNAAKDDKFTELLKQEEEAKMAREAKKNGKSIKKKKKDDNVDDEMEENLFFNTGESLEAEK